MKYYSRSGHFTCDCEYTQFSGFICRHIFRSAIQLNLEELSTSLFYERWRKNPSEKDLINAYTNFYSIATSTHHSTSISQHSPLAFNNESSDFQYMLIRLLQKVQRFTVQNPEVAETLYTSISEIYDSEIEKVNRIQTQNSKVTPTIKNPLVVHGKGRPSNKRITSITELTSKSNKKKRKTNENIPKPQESVVNNNRSTQNTQPLHEIQPLNTLPSQQYRCPSPPSTKYQSFSETNFLSNELNLGNFF